MRGACGAVTGALMVLGMAFGHSEEMMVIRRHHGRKVAEFKKRFLEKYPSDMCREILGHDISKPGEMDKVLEKALCLISVRRLFWMCCLF
mgnify:CR=1 FL=1